MKALLMVLLMIIALNVADVWTTFQILEKGGTELNPFVKEITTQTIMFKMIMVMTLSISATISYHYVVKERCGKGKAFVWCVVLFVMLWYGYVTANNSLVLMSIA